MWFNSYIFIVFFVVVYFSYIHLKHRSQNTLLLAASYFFYGMWDVRFLALILLSTIVDYFCGLHTQNSNSPRSRKLALFTSLVVNLGALGFFKYFNFFAENLAVVFNSFGMELDPITLNVILPIGISFYTFQTLSYSIDLYFGKGKATKNFLDFAFTCYSDSHHQKRSPDSS
jgi:alginate O-acetyltransferase complex protein AlgI